jgi:hypothetical protein
MTSACPVRQSFSGGGPPSSFVDFVASCETSPTRIIPKDPEIGWDMTLEFKKTAPITPNLFMSNQLTTNLTLKSAAFSRVFPGFLRASQRLFCSPTRGQSHVTICPRESYVAGPRFDPLYLISRLMCLHVSYPPLTRPLTPLCGPFGAFLRALGEGRGSAFARRLRRDKESHPRAQPSAVEARSYSSRQEVTMQPLAGPLRPTASS